MYSTTSSTNLERSPSGISAGSLDGVASSSSVPSCGRTFPLSEGLTPHLNNSALKAAANAAAVGLGFQPPVERERFTKS